MSGLECLAVICTIGGIALTAQRRLLGWPLSLIAALLYLVVFARARLYADAGLQILFCVFVLRGWYAWYTVRACESAIPVRVQPRWTIWRDLTAGLCLSLLLGLVLGRWTQDAAPMTDATLSVFSLIGQLWTGQRYRACWLLWMAVDAAYVALFVSRDLFLTAALYAGLVGLAFWGWHRWRTSPGPDSGA